VSELPPALRLAAAALVAAAGASIGSFLNVVIARVPAGESVVTPRSRCPRCGRPIAWYDNVPVLSWLALRARCRRCAAPISWRYPLVELAVAGLALAAVARHGLGGAALAELAFAALLVALAAIDLDTWLLPHALTWPLLALGLVASLLGAAAAPSPTSSALGAGIGFAVFAAISVGGERLLKKEALGFGDVWLLAGLGAFLGVGALLPIVLLASVQGAVAGVVLILIGKAQPGPPTSTATSSTPTTTSTPSPTSTSTPTTPSTARAATDDDDWIPPKNAVPFGPFLVAAGLEWLYAGDLVARALPALEVFR
jgi:leader peptidase (prepilin peptidase)/N-methyltransferase